MSGQFNSNNVPFYVRLTIGVLTMLSTANNKANAMLKCATVMRVWQLAS